MDYCGGCHSNHPKDQFIWDGKRYKTCKRCKERRDNKGKGNELDHQDNFEVLPGEHSAGFVTNKNSEPEHRSYAEVDYLDLGDLIEHEIQELTTDAQVDGVADVAYQTHLAVNLDSAMFQDRTAKEIANLVVAKIEDGDDYS
ncbi:hypothetical protein C2G38_2179998 [Gigaspora rosea]|uniref:Uncharacterized protein n=1 Tax=Gigaspora rosea TaxID=44941 RepID=A0A397VCF9_9GLOM|nr:hypothetical protein C2G38_2179998 [Gigaspora rosea]